MYVCQEAKAFFTYAVANVKKKRDEHKALWKKYCSDLKVADTSDDRETLKRKVDVEYNIQLSYKCLLNSFYGALSMISTFAGGRGMETAGVICDVARKIICSTDDMLDAFSKRINRDTDGVFRKIPKSFRYVVKSLDGKSVNLVDCLLHDMIRSKFSNPSFETGHGIEFEDDGPYGTMFLSSSNDGDMVTKKYVVYDLNGKMKEVKGLELKRRGEWGVLKSFQTSYFDVLGSCVFETTLLGCYNVLKSRVVDFYDNLFRTRGGDVEDRRLVELLSEEKVASRAVTDYKARILVVDALLKMRECSGDEELGKTAKCSVRFVLSKYPRGQKTKYGRAIPTVIYDMDTDIRNKFISKWTMQDDYVELRDILDWDDYSERWSNARNRLYTYPRSIQCGGEKPIGKGKRKSVSDVYDVRKFFKPM